MPGSAKWVIHSIAKDAVSRTAMRDWNQPGSPRTLELGGVGTRWEAMGSGQRRCVVSGNPWIAVKGRGANVVNSGQAIILCCETGLQGADRAPGEWPDLDAQTHSAGDVLTYPQPKTAPAIRM